MEQQIEEIFQEIKKQYNQELFTIGELKEILVLMGYSKAEARAIVLKSLNKGITGRVSLRRRSVLPRPTSIIALL